MPAHDDIPVAQFAADHGYTLARLRVFRDKQFVRHQRAEPPVDFEESVERGRRIAQTAAVEPGLHLDVRDGLQLQIPLLRIVPVVPRQRSLDVHGMRVVPLDEIAVVAVHRAHDVRQRVDHPRR